MAVPVALGIALYITQYAPRRIATLLGYVTDMLAAVPERGLRPVGAATSCCRTWSGCRASSRSTSAGSRCSPTPTASPHPTASRSSPPRSSSRVMILPIVAAISREVLRQVDPAQKEAALALGATRWEMIRTAVLPPSRPGIISATMLGLGRALGETIAVALVIGNTYKISPHVLSAGGNTIAVEHRQPVRRSGHIGRSALIASGLVLFVLTLAVNLVARYIILRSGTEERSSRMSSHRRPSCCATRASGRRRCRPGRSARPPSARSCSHCCSSHSPASPATPTSWSSRRSDRASHCRASAGSVEGKRRAIDRIATNARARRPGR